MLHESIRIKHKNDHLGGIMGDQLIMHQGVVVNLCLIFQLYRKVNLCDFNIHISR